MNYPQLYLPKEITESFDITFPTPIKPSFPVAPIEPRKSEIFIGFICTSILAIIFFFIKLPIIGIILVGGYLISIFSNSSKNQYKNKLRKYNLEIIAYNNLLKEYEIDIKINNQKQYQIHKRNQIKDKVINNSSKFSQNKDYKKGISHEYFKKYLIKNFNNSIIENVSINNKKYVLEDIGEFDLYVTDFAYIDKYTNLKINIEIDEPYTLETQIPIHLNDTNRNNFFIKNNWIVLRFAEEQVVNSPELCCDLIRQIIYCFDTDILLLKNLKSNIPEVQKWNSESVKLLIKKDYRNSYLNGKVYFRI